MRRTIFTMCLIAIIWVDYLTTQYLWIIWSYPSSKGFQLSEIIQILETIGVLGATYFAYKSTRIGNATILEMKKQDYPRIIVFVRQKPDSIHVLELVIRNEGRSSARNLQFTITNDIYFKNTKRNLSEIRMVKDGIALLPGLEDRVNPLTVFLGEEFDMLLESNCSVRAYYQNVDGHNFEETFKLDFKGLVDRKIGNTWTEEVAKALKEIHKDIERMGRDIYHATNKIVEIRPQTFYEDEKYKETEKI